MYELFKLFNWFYWAKHSFGLLPLALMVTVVVTMMMMKLRVGARRVPNSCSTPVLPQGNVLTRTRTRRRDTSFSTSKGRIILLRRCSSSLRMGGETDSDVLFLGRNMNHEKSFRKRIPLHRRASTQSLAHKKERVVLSYQKKVRRWLSSQFLVRLCFMPN